MIVRSESGLPRPDAPQAMDIERRPLRPFLEPAWVSLRDSDPQQPLVVSNIVLPTTILVLRCGVGLRYALWGALYALYASTPRQRASHSVVCDASVSVAPGERNGLAAEVPIRCRGSTPQVHPNNAAHRSLPKGNATPRGSSGIQRILHT